MEFDGHAIGPWERNPYGQKFAIMLRVPHVGLFRFGFENAQALEKFIQLVFQLDEFRSLLEAEAEFRAGLKENSQTASPNEDHVP